jgi:hypothetical protein
MRAESDVEKVVLSLSTSTSDFQGSMGGLSGMDSR